VFPAALAIADDPLNFGDRAEKMNESDCSNTAHVMKGMHRPDQGPTPPDLSCCSLLQWRSGRESLVYTKKFHTLHLTVGDKMTKFQGGYGFLDLPIHTHFICN